MNIINEHEQSNGNNTNIIIESSANNNDLIYYTFNRNGLLSYYIHSNFPTTGYLVMELLLCWPLNSADKSRPARWKNACR